MMGVQTKIVYTANARIISEDANMMRGSGFSRDNLS